MLQGLETGLKRIICRQIRTSWSLSHSFTRSAVAIHQKGMAQTLKDQRFCALLSWDRSKVMLKLRQSLLDVEEQLSEIRRKHSETLAELDNAKRELVTARSDCLAPLIFSLASTATNYVFPIVSLVDKDKLEALSELKAAANTDLAELQGIHVDLEKKYKDLDVEMETKRSLLNTVLLEKDEISKNLSTQKDQVLERELAMSDLRTTIAAFEGSAEGRDGALERRVTQLQQKLEDRRERMTKSKEHIKKQNAIIKELKEQLDNAVKADADEKIQAMEERLVSPIGYSRKCTICS
jgi:protein HOOK3